MSEILIASTEEAAAIARGSKTAQPVDAVQERIAALGRFKVMDGPRVAELLHLMLPKLVPLMVDPALSAIYQDLAMQGYVLMALKEIIMEKFEINEEEFKVKMHEVADRMKNTDTPNSPAKLESEQAAQGKVERLDEPGRPIMDSTDEQAPRRLIEGA